MKTIYYLIQHSYESTFDQGIEKWTDSSHNMLSEDGAKEALASAMRRHPGVKMRLIKRTTEDSVLQTVVPRKDINIGDDF